MTLAGEENPWRALSSQLQADLEGPLFDAVRYNQDKAAFKKWWSLHYTEDPATGLLRSKRFSSAPGVYIHSLYPEWRWNHSANAGFNREGRNSFLCVYAKLKMERLWKFVESVDWVGTSGEILFHPKGGPSPLRAYLLSHEYGRWWMADWGKDSSGQSYAWGLRSIRIGCELHFRVRKDPSAPIDAHIDLNNPGKESGPLSQAVLHKVQDDWRRGKTHNQETLRSALVCQRMIVPTVP